MEHTALTPLLDVTTRDGSTFACAPLAFERRVLGGGVVAAVTLAAARTLDEASGARDRPPAALDVTFCRAGLVDEPLAIDLERIHDGGTSIVRRAVVRQGERSIAIANVRFHAAADDDTDTWEPVAPTDVPDPDACRPEHAVLATLDLLAGCDVRAQPAAGPAGGRRLHPFWIRVPTVPDVPALHEALVGLVTDLGTSTAAARPKTSFRERIRAVSLDHSVRWHRPVRADDWLLVDASPTVVGHRRSTVRGDVRDRAGHLLASFAQEVAHPPPR